MVSFFGGSSASYSGVFSCLSDLLAPVVPWFNREREMLRHLPSVIIPSDLSEANPFVLFKVGDCEFLRALPLHQSSGHASVVKAFKAELVETAFNHELAQTIADQVVLCGGGLVARQEGGKLLFYHKSGDYGEPDLEMLNRLMLAELSQVKFRYQQAYPLESEVLKRRLSDLPERSDC